MKSGSVFLHAREASRRRGLDGIVVMLAGIFLLTTTDAVVKRLTADYSVVQILFFRNLFAMLPVLIFVRSQGGLAALKTHRPLMYVYRVALSCGTATAFFWALSSLPLADATVLLFTGPMFITILSAPLLGEKVGFARWVAVIIGLAGVIVIARPGSGLLAFAALASQLSVACYALLMISNRSLRNSETAAALAFYNTFGVLVITLVLTPWMFRAPTLVDVGLFAIAGLLAGVGQIGLIIAFRWTVAAVVAPFEYTGLVWATLYGFLFWNHLPDGWAVLGAAIILVAGIYITHHESTKTPDREPHVPFP